MLTPADRSHNYCLLSSPRGVLPCGCWFSVVQNLTKLWLALLFKTSPKQRHTFGLQKHAFGLGGTYFPDTFQVAQLLAFVSLLTWTVARSAGLGETAGGGESPPEGGPAETQYWNHLLLWSHRTSSRSVSQGVTLWEVPAHLCRSKSSLWIRGRTSSHLSAAGGGKKNRFEKTHSCSLFASLIHNVASLVFSWMLWTLGLRDL